MKVKFKDLSHEQRNKLFEIYRSMLSDTFLKAHELLLVNSVRIDFFFNFMRSDKRFSDVLKSEENKQILREHVDRMRESFIKQLESYAELASRHELDEVIVMRERMIKE